MQSNNLFCRDVQTILYEEENCPAVQLPVSGLISLCRKKSRFSIFARCIILMLILLTSLRNLAQDTLVLHDGSYRLVREATITDTQVKFRPFPETDSLVHVISKSDCQKIVYQGGKTVDFKNFWLPEPAGLEKTVTDPTDHGRNIISLNVVDLFYRSLTINYEFLSRQGNLSIKCPISIGFVALGLSENKLYSEDERQAYHHPNKYFSIGAELLYYHGKYRKIRYFAGPGFEYGKYEYYSYYSIYDHHKSTFISFLAQTGVMFQMSKHLAMAGNLGFGYSTSGSYDGSAFNALRFGIALGYKF
jgi:hypothetical protein